MNNWHLPPIPEDVIDFAYIDLDGVIADFELEMNAQGYLDPKVYKYVPGAYTYLPLMSHAMEAVKTLRAAMGAERVWFLSKPPCNAPYVWAEKAIWMRHHFGDVGLHNLIITMDKSHVGTEKSLLIDDRPHKGGVDRFRGTFIHFRDGWHQVFDDLRLVLTIRPE